MRKAKIYEHAGQKLTMAEWSSLLHIPISTLWVRMQKNQSLSKVLGPAEQIKRIIQNENSTQHKQESICWKCIHRKIDLERMRGCSWAYNLTMVEGAEYTERETRLGKYKTITSCPRFEEEKKC